MAEIILVHSKSKLVKVAPIGFSLTCFCFGAFAPLINRNVNLTILTLLWCSAFAGISLTGYGLLISIPAHLVLCSVINSLHIEQLLRDGYEPADENEWKRLLQCDGFKLYKSTPAEKTNETPINL